MSQHVSIKICHLTKKYRIYNSPKDRFKEIASNGKIQTGSDFVALNDLTVDIHEGEIWGIIGTNGSGKSTLLKMITGVLTPTEGEVIVNGKISALLELGAGFNPEYTGIENIYFYGMLTGFSRKEMEEKIPEIVAFANIGDFVFQPVKTYSSGMFVRLAYAVAISIEPDILIVDEALSVGDSYFQMKSMSKMEELFKKGKTVLLVSHDIASVKSLCNKAILLDKGNVIAIGNAKDVVELYEKRIRDDMSATKELVIKKDEVKKASDENIPIVSSKYFLYDENYMDHVKHSREGNQKAKVCSVQVFDILGNEKSVFDFNEIMIIKISIVIEENCTFSIGYHIRDEKNIIILGNNTIYENIGEVTGKKGEKIIAEFETKLPLQEGRYNIMSVLSSTVIQNRSVEFVDVTKDGLYFDVLEAKPVRVWNKVQLSNKILINKIIE